MMVHEQETAEVVRWSGDTLIPAFRRERIADLTQAQAHDTGNAPLQVSNHYISHYG